MDSVHTFQLFAVVMLLTSCPCAIFGDAWWACWPLSWGAASFGPLCLCYASLHLPHCLSALGGGGTPGGPLAMSLVLASKMGSTVLELHVHVQVVLVHVGCCHSHGIFMCLVHGVLVA